MFQFFIVAILSALIGHIYLLYKLQRSKEKEIELLKVENLQSRYDALTNQINPHFFFNSLNGLTSLIRKQHQEATLTYVLKLSDVFRYILRSDKKGLVSLAEELAFVRSFAYMMEVRFANKIYFDIAVSTEMLTYQLPVLSILPLLDNIVVHNTIDSLHQMNIRIDTDQSDNLRITSPIFPKIQQPDTTGTGLKNLGSRFKLLLNREIQIEERSDTFTVILPLNKGDIR